MQLILILRPCAPTGSKRAKAFATLLQELDENMSWLRHSKKLEAGSQLSFAQRFLEYFKTIISESLIYAPQFMFPISFLKIISWQIISRIQPQVGKRDAFSRNALGLLGAHGD